VLRGDETPMRGIYLTDGTSKSDGAVLLKGIDTSQIVCITSRTASILDHLKNGEFPNCKALAILSGKVHNILPQCEEFSLLKYLNVAGCPVTSKKKFRASVEKWKYFPLALQTLEESASCNFLPQPMSLKKCIVHLLEEPSPFQYRHRSFHPISCPWVNHFEILSNLLNPNPDEKQYVGLPLNSGLKTFICTATPNQVTCYIDTNQYYVEKPYGFDMRDDECVINFYNCFANCTTIIVHIGFSWQIWTDVDGILTVTFDMVTLPEGTVVQYLESPSEVPSNTINKL